MIREYESSHVLFRKLCNESYSEVRSVGVDETSQLKDINMFQYL